VAAVLAIVAAFAFVDFGFAGIVVYFERSNVIG
jgi:hypothetical protein